MPPKNYDKLAKMKDMAGATVGQVPVAAGDGSWAPGDQTGGATVNPIAIDNVEGQSNRFIGFSSANHATMLARMISHLAHAKTAITEGGYEGKSYYSPGGPYTDFYSIELLSGILSSGARWFTADELKAMLDFNWSKRINDGVTTYTRPYSGGTDTYEEGTLPDSTPADGVMATHHYVPQGDKPLLTNQWGDILLAYYWGSRSGWNSTWLAWFTANAADLAVSFDAAPFNGVSGLVTQYAGSYKATGLYVLAYLDGDHYMESCWAHNAARALAYMYSKAGNTASASTWTTRADDIRDSIRAAFVEVPTPLWDAFHEKYVGLARGTGTPRGYELIAGGGTGSVEVLADPDDATSNLIKITSTGGSYHEIDKNFESPSLVGEPYEGEHTRLYARAKTAQTNVAAIVLRVDGTTGGPNVMVTFGSDGHFKYYNGASHVNLPTDTTYVADTWYEMEIRVIWGATNTAEIFIGGASKGTITLLNTSNDMAQHIIGMEGGNGNVTYDYHRWAAVPTSADQGACGYLDWAAGPYGKQFSPMATAYAVYSGILTPDQCVKASRWFSILYDQPDFTGWSGAGGRRELFSQIANYRGYVRWMRWADDWEAGQASVYPIIPAASPDYDYGKFVNGGYMNWGLLWIAYTMSLTDQAKAAEYLGNAIADVETIGSNAPYENVKATDRTPTNAQYLQGAFAWFEAGRI